MEKRARTRTKPIPVYPCEICNENMFGREKDCSRRRFCKSCFEKRKADNYETFCCAMCGKEVARRKHHKKEVNAKVCSRFCQQKWRGFVALKNSEKGRLLKESQRQKLKVLAFIEKTKNKQLLPFTSAVIRINRKVRARQKRKDDVWVTTLFTRLSQYRPKPIFVETQNVKQEMHQTWEEAFLCAIKQIEWKKRWQQKDGWIKKITNKLSNAKKRMRGKDERKNKSSKDDQKQARSQWLQMRFDWMDIDA